MSDKKLKWGFIQPLTGGAYWGARLAIGCPAAWILSFPGLCAHREKEDGSIYSAANEYHLMKYLQKKGELPPYLTINREMFAEFKSDPKAFEPELIKNEFSTTDTKRFSFGWVRFFLQYSLCCSLEIRNATRKKKSSMTARR